MNDRFDKAFADIFGASTPKPTVGHKTASRSNMYPGSVGARTPVTLKSGHESLTAKCMVSAHTSPDKMQTSVLVNGNGTVLYRAQRHNGQP